MQNLKHISIIFICSWFSVLSIHAQTYNHSFGVNIGISGGDGTDVGLSYDVFYTRKLSNTLQIKLGYFNCDHSSKLKDFHIEEEFFHSPWVSSQNTSSNPTIEHSNAWIYTLGLSIRMNHFGKSGLFLMPMANYYEKTTQYLSGSGSDIFDLDFSGYSYKGLGFGLEVQYKYQVNEVLACNAAGFFISGIFQAGAKIGMEASF